MRLTSHTDYGLRLLMVGAASAPAPISVTETASRIHVSRHHLMKIAQRLTKGGMIKPVRGRSGGFCLAKNSSDIRIGEVVRLLEVETGLVECMRSGEGMCPLENNCRLPLLFQTATDGFFRVLDSCTLQDLIAENSGLIQLSAGRNQ